MCYGATSYHYASSGVNTLYRAWSDRSVEARSVSVGTSSCGAPNACRTWGVISSPNEGLNAAAYINHDEIVNAADIGLLLSAWGPCP